MVKRISLSDAECPVARALDIIGDWWSLLIVRDAFDGARRFGEFQRSLGVSRGILSARLRNLVALGILAMQPAADGSAYEDYVLTDKGCDLFPVVVALRQWGERHCFRAGAPHSVLIEDDTGECLSRMEVRSKKGRILRASDTTVRKLEGAQKPKHGSASHRKRTQHG
jgi:DNA-binding HxlR family transcriptional regulator